MPCVHLFHIIKDSILLSSLPEEGSSKRQCKRQRKTRICSKRRRQNVFNTANNVAARVYSATSVPVHIGRIPVVQNKHDSDAVHRQSASQRQVNMTNPILEACHLLIDRVILKYMTMSLIYVFTILVYTVIHLRNCSLLAKITKWLVTIW